jgi:hypothetical protein
VEGRVLIRSAPGAGTTVRAELPALHRDGSEQVSATRSTRSAEG